MRPPVVVEAEPFLQAPAQARQRAVFKQIDPLVFHASPKSLNEDVVHPAPFAVHADFYSQIRQAARPFRRSELAALIRMNHDRRMRLAAPQSHQHRIEDRTRVNAAADAKVTMPPSRSFLLSKPASDVPDH